MWTWRCGMNQPGHYTGKVRFLLQTRPFLLLPILHKISSINHCSSAPWESQKIVDMTFPPMERFLFSSDPIRLGKSTASTVSWSNYVCSSVPKLRPRLRNEYSNLSGLRWILARRSCETVTQFYFCSNVSKRGIAPKTFSYPKCRVGYAPHVLVQCLSSAIFFNFNRPTIG